MITSALKIFRQVNRAPEILRCRHAESLRLTLSYTGLSPLTYPFKAHLTRGHVIDLADQYDLATFWQVFFHRVYPVHADDAVIIDAGANIGTFTLYAVRTAPAARVLSIEPFPPTYDRLVAAVVNNGLTGRAICINAALGGNSGTAVIQSDDMPSQFRRLRADDTGSVIRIPQITLASLVDEYRLRAIDLLKLDIEGSEYASILRTPISVLKEIRRIALEYHPLYSGEKFTKQELFEHLQQAGLVKVHEQDAGEGYGIAHFHQSTAN